MRHFVFIIILLSAFCSPADYAQSMTFETGATHAGFTFTGWTYSSGTKAIYQSDFGMGGTASITVNSSTWSPTEVDVNPFAFDAGTTVNVSSNLSGSGITFDLGSNQTIVLAGAEFDNITSLIFTKMGGSAASPDIDNIDYGGVLPVELISFTAEAIDNSVLLKWQTATEVNNYGFEIGRQKSEIGSHNSEWETIGFVQGYGNSNSPKQYEFADDDAPLGKIRYRLKQIDTDGTYEYYSQIAEVDLSSITSFVNSEIPTEFSLSQNYPNPFNPTTTIQYTISVVALSPAQRDKLREVQHITLRIYDILGRQIATLVNKVQSPGNYSVEWNASSYASGLYFYKLISGNFQLTKKMTVIK